MIPEEKTAAVTRGLREAFRLSQNDLPAGLDFLVVPKQTEKPELKPVAAS